MNSIRVHKTGGPEVLRIEEIPDPAPGPGELLVNIEAIGVNFIEIYQRAGAYPMTRPYTPGAEAAGVVRQVGSGVTDFSVGDRVVSQMVKGAYAEPAEPPGTAEQLAVELARMSGWLGLERVVVEPRGDLAPALTAAIAAVVL